MQEREIVRAQTSRTTTCGTPVRSRRGPSRGPRRRRASVETGPSCRADLHPTSRAFSATKGARWIFESGLDSTSRRIPRLGTAGPRVVRRSWQHDRRATRTLAEMRSLQRGSHSRWLHGQPWISRARCRQRPGIPCFGFGRIAALSRARAAGVGEDHVLDRGRCPRSMLRQKSDDDVAPERATPRETGALHRPASGEGRNPRGEPTSGNGSRRRSREIVPTHRA